MIFRNDDVNPNSDIDAIRAMYDTILRHFPDAEIWSAVNILGKTSSDGSAYAQIKPADIYFPSVDRVFDLSRLPELENIASHGLYHLDHRGVGREVQEYSIVSSCEILGTRRFVPPFWRWNAETIRICKDAGILLWIEGDWVNLDTNPLLHGVENFLFHSWKFTPETFAAKFAGVPIP